ncbi:MAG: hypothetical protein PHU42_02735 [Patescibacteria group bacterium]|nr:hypothetical protein [Patescibacteria group bacterium]
MTIVWRTVYCTFCDAPFKVLDIESLLPPHNHNGRQCLGVGFSGLSSPLSGSTTKVQGGKEHVS